MKPKQALKDFFLYTRKERLGIIITLVLIFLVFIAPHLLFNSPVPGTTKTSSEILALIDTLENANNSQLADNRKENYYVNSEEKGSDVGFEEKELFFFDPNTATASEWERLGLNKRIIKTILNYRAKGGKFYKTEDLKKIWGLPPEFYETVKEYISIQQPEQNSPTFARLNFQKQEKKSIPRIDINSADTSAFIALPGIGNKLANRIINFRNKLGGFYTIEQVKETYGLPDSTFERIKPYLFLQTGHRKININTASKDELKAHPYIKWSLANAIVEYRNQHGKYGSLNDLKKITLINEADFERISPYLEVN